MSESTVVDSTADVAESVTEKPAAAATPQTPADAGLPRAVTFGALGLGVLGAVLGVLGLFFPTHGGVKYSDQQVQEAKTSVCDAAKKVRQAVGVSTHLQNPDPNSPIAGIAVAGNARLGLFAGGQYLRAVVAQNPAAPADLAASAVKTANALEELSLNYLGGAPETVQNPLRKDLDAQVGELDGLCQK